MIHNLFLSHWALHLSIYSHLNFRASRWSYACIKSTVSLYGENTWCFLISLVLIKCHKAPLLISLTHETRKPRQEKWMKLGSDSCSQHLPKEKNVLRAERWHLASSHRETCFFVVCFWEVPVLIQKIAAVLLHVLQVVHWYEKRLSFAWLE